MSRYLEHYKKDGRATLYWAKHCQTIQIPDSLIYSVYITSVVEFFLSCFTEHGYYWCNGTYSHIIARSWSNFIINKCWEVTKNRLNTLTNPSAKELMNRTLLALHTVDFSVLCIKKCLFRSTGDDPFESKTTAYMEDIDSIWSHPNLLWDVPISFSFVSILPLIGIFQIDGDEPHLQYGHEELSLV